MGRVGCKLFRLLLCLSNGICFCWLGKSSVGLVSGLAERPKSFFGSKEQIRRGGGTVVDTEPGL